LAWQREAANDHSDGSGSLFLSKPYRPWFDASLKAAEVQNVHWHCLRHTFGSTLTMKGGDIQTLAGLMEHKSLQMMQCFHLVPEYTAGSVGKMEGFFNATDTVFSKPARGSVLAFLQVAMND
jgi:hypothetical protein